MNIRRWIAAGVLALGIGGVAAIPPAGAATVNWPSNGTDYAHWVYGRPEWESVVVQQGSNAGAYIRVDSNPSDDSFCIWAWYYRVDVGYQWTAPDCFGGADAYAPAVRAVFVPTNATVYGRKIQFVNASGQVVAVCDTTWNGLSYC